MTKARSRLFSPPSRGKKLVFVFIFNWRGYARRASHWRAIMHEETRNGVGGRTFEKRFASQQAAEDYIKAIQEKHFPTSTHKLIHKISGQKWNGYKVIGD